MQLAYTGPVETPTARPTRVHRPAPLRLDGRGLDLAAHYEDVRAAVMSSCSVVCGLHDIDPEDLISTVCESVLLSNLRESAYDPARASVTRYLRTLAVSRLLHMLDKVRRRRRAEQVGVRGLGRDAAEQDAASIDVPHVICPDVAVAVKRLLPGMLERARAADRAERAERAPRAVDAIEGAAPGQGWHEQAVQWAVIDSPSSAAAAGWWKCTVLEATSRLAWARDAWTEAVTEMCDGQVLEVDELAAARPRRLPRFR